MNNKKVAKTFKERLKKVNWNTVGLVVELSVFGFGMFKLGQTYNNWVFDRGVKRLTDDGFVSMTKPLPDGGGKEIIDTTATTEWKRLVYDHYGIK